MAKLDRSFIVQDAPDAAQERFVAELGPVLTRWGFRLQSRTNGHLRYGPALIWGKSFLLSYVLWLGASAYYLSRLARGQRIEAAFREGDDGCEVQIYARTSRGIANNLEVLGRPGHWPDVAEDPDWLPEHEPVAYDWEGIEPASMDRITRRAYRRSQRAAGR